MSTIMSSRERSLGERASEGGPTLLGKVRAFPRAVQWALGGAVLLAAYFGVVEPVLERSGEMGGKASALETSLRGYAQSKARLDAAVEAVKLGERQFGVLALPEETATRSTAFSSAIDAIMKRNGIVNVTSGTRSTALEKGPLLTAVGAGTRAERLIKELTFMATPEALAGAIADLEREPLVTTISRVNIRQTEGPDRFNRMMQVTIAAETWVLVKKAK